MSTLNIKFHHDALSELQFLTTSKIAMERKAAEQIVVLLQVIQANSYLRARLLVHFESLWFVDNSVKRQIDIKIIQELKSIADDDKYFTDAVRRIRDLSNKPIDNYRIFFAPAKLNHRGDPSIRILGIFPRETAYLSQTLAMLKQRYGE